MVHGKNEAKGSQAGKDRTIVHCEEGKNGQRGGRQSWETGAELERAGAVSVSPLSSLTGFIPAR